jgi:hypothetical protein
MSPDELLDTIHAAHTAGLKLGIGIGRRRAEEEMAALHRAAYRVVQAHARLQPFDEASRARRARWIAAAARHQAAAVPWPEETSRIPRGARDGCGTGPRPPDPNVPGDKGATGWPLVVVLTPAERARRAAS